MSDLVELAPDGYEPNAWLRQLLRLDQLLCPKCRGPLKPMGPNLVCDKCRKQYPFVDDVAELYLPEPISSSLKIGPYVDSIMARYTLPDGDRLAVERLVNKSLTSSGRDSLAAEINMFVDRFALYNSDLRLSVVRHYVSAPLPSETTIYRAFRIRNEGDFPWVPSAEHHLHLSYHLLRSDGAVVEFDGPRTALPMEILPSREITLPVCIRTPVEPGRYILRLMLVREMLRWGEEGAVDVPIIVERAPGLTAACGPGETTSPFSEALDSQISIRMLTEILHRTSPRGGTIDLVEIGGGNSPESLMIFRNCQEHQLNIRILNVDVSASLLRLGALQLRHHHPDAYAAFSFLTADANDLPLPSGIADVVLLFRALHHFPDPVHTLRVCRDKLRPNGFVALMCEPVGNAYDSHASRLLAAGVNEQVFALEDYFTMFREAGLRIVNCRCDWGFSFKAILVRD